VNPSAGFGAAESFIKRGGPWRDMKTMKQCIHCGRVRENGKESSVITAWVNRMNLGSDGYNRTVTQENYSDFIRHHIFICDQCNNSRIVGIVILSMILVPLVAGAVALIVITDSPVFCFAAAAVIIPIGVLLVWAINRNGVSGKILKSRGVSEREGGYEVVHPSARVIRENPELIIGEEYLVEPAANEPPAAVREAENAPATSSSGKWIWVIVILALAFLGVSCLCLVAGAAIFQADIVHGIDNLF
jgi:hypothetical protein